MDSRVLQAVSNKLRLLRRSAFAMYSAWGLGPGVAVPLNSWQNQIGL